MADHHGTPHFQNDAGHDIVHIGATSFMCVGANPPFDHPHVYLEMGDEGEKVCPYCSTLYKVDNTLKHGETRPAGCVFHDRAA